MLDVIVVIAYFFFLMMIGWLFRTFSKNTSDYFKGGGKAFPGEHDERYTVPAQERCECRVKTRITRI